MIKHVIIYLCLLLGTIIVVSCNKDDGKWDSIQITINGKVCKSETFKVPTDGGEFNIYSNNYGSLWLKGVKENDKIVWPENFDFSDFRNIHLTKEWYEIKYDNSGNINICIKPKQEEDSKRSLNLSLESGDVFKNITLVQE